VRGVHLKKEKIASPEGRGDIVSEALQLVEVMAVDVPFFDLYFVHFALNGYWIFTIRDVHGASGFFRIFGKTEDSYKLSLNFSDIF